MTTDNRKIKRWILPEPIKNKEILNCPINYTLQKVLSRRGLNLEVELESFLSPSNLPKPEDHFSELNKATQRVIYACNKNERIAICGDYDADGITSTALLVEILSKIGADAVPYIPSRQDDGYGLNLKMINDIYNNNIRLIITVDNGISATEAINKANELDIDLIITDHHKIPNKNRDIFALIHPEKSPNNSPYKCLAGVGIAYMLAKHICKTLNFDFDTTSANELFCIGTIADMAPLVGANRIWLKENLPKIRATDNLAIRSIIKKLLLDETEITTEDIGYKIAPLINSVGRIGDPKLIIDLLTNTSKASIIKLTKECISLNKERKRLTKIIEEEAFEIAFKQFNNNRKFLVLKNDQWHPGIIGIVAARMVDHFNLPTAILSKANNGIFRGSVRSNNQIKVNLALSECKDILISYGGHSAAAGFSISEDKIPTLLEKLNNIAIRELNNRNLSKSIKPDAYLCFKDINIDFFKQLTLLGPFGINNQAPIFWTRKCKIIEQYKLKGNHVRFKLSDGTAIIDAIRWNAYSQLDTNKLIDIAFYIEINKWRKCNTIQLNIVDIKEYKKVVDLQIHNRLYKCQLIENLNVLITNKNGSMINSSKLSTYNDKQKNLFAKKIISFAEIALGIAV